MPTAVFVAVLAAALLHASWNAVVKSSGDAATETVLLVGCAGALSLLVAAFAPAPAAASWPFAALSAGVHVAYFALVAAAYGAGDLSLAYPLMRGAAPLLVAAAAAADGAERPSPAAWAGILLVCGGVVGLALARRAEGPPPARAVALALANAVVIATYTLVDGAGVRRSGSPLGYTAWVFVLTAAPLVAWAAVARRRRLAAQLAARWRTATAGAACTVAGYALALWAMTRAPIAPVAALRETSILFGVALARVALGERVGGARALAAGAVAAGAVALRLAP